MSARPAQAAATKPGLAGPSDLKTPEPIDLICGDTFDLDPRRSLAVTDQALLTGFTSSRVMEQIVDTSRRARPHPRGPLWPLVGLPEHLQRRAPSPRPSTATTP
jgi:hypothetical protein